jgi:hypothetical protein
MGLERWLLRPCEVNVAGGGVVKLKLSDLTAALDLSQEVSYGVTNGSQTLRGEIAGWFGDVDPDEVLITTGTSEANLLANLHLLTPGDEYVGIFPEYTQTSPFAEALGCTVRKVFLDESKGWELNIDHVKEAVTAKTKIIFFDNPNNPTGSVLSSDHVRAICEIAEDAGAYVICDNALRGSELDGKTATTPFPHYDRGIVTGSMSKLGMTGLRIGWLIGDREFVNACWQIKDYTTLSHSGIGEPLAIGAMRNENLTKYVRRNTELSRSNRDSLSDWIKSNSDSYSWIKPNAGFTGFLKYSMPLSSVEFCSRFLQQQKVLISPGEYFGVDEHFRFNYGCTPDTLKEALSRFKRFTSKLLGDR